MDFKKLGLVAVFAMLAAPFAFATYSGTYDATDIPAIVIDFLGGLGVQAVAFVSLIALVIILGYVAAKAKQLM